jgi:hypothetical protein
VGLAPRPEPGRALPGRPQHSQPVPSPWSLPFSSSTPSLADSRLIALVAVLATVVAIGAPTALADGDPASDYLLSEPIFLPIDHPVSANKASAFQKLVLGAEKSGLEIKVAVISSPYDLGSVPILYGTPQRYADFLGQELFYYYKHMILIVMPNGYGIYNNGKSTAEARAVLAKLPPAKSTNGNVLTAAGTRAVEALAKRYDVTISASSSSSASSNNQDRLELGLAAVVLVLLTLGVGLLRRRWRSR